MINISEYPAIEEFLSQDPSLRLQIKIEKIGGKTLFIAEIYGNPALFLYSRETSIDEAMKWLDGICVEWLDEIKHTKEPDTYLLSYFIPNYGVVLEAREFMDREDIAAYIKSVGGCEGWMAWKVI